MALQQTFLLFLPKIMGKAKIFVTWPILDNNAKILSDDENFAEKAKIKKTTSTRHYILFRKM